MTIASAGSGVAPAQRPGGEHRERRRDREQVLVALHGPELEEHHRHGDPTDEQALPPRRLAPVQPERRRGGHDHQRADGLRNGRRIEQPVVVRPAEQLPGEVALARPGVSGHHQAERKRRYHESHDAQRDGQVPQAYPQLGSERKERVDGAEEDDAGLLGQEREAHRRASRVQPRRTPTEDEAREEEERERGEERHRPVEEHLAGHDHVVGHQRHQKGRDEAGPASRRAACRARRPGRRSPLPSPRQRSARTPPRGLDASRATERSGAEADGLERPETGPRALSPPLSPPPVRSRRPRRC